MLNVPDVRRQFPFFLAKPKTVYLDSAATAQKPQAVLDSLLLFSSENSANVHRGMYELSERATENFEQARDTVRKFLGAKHTDEIIFTKNATEALNVVSKSWGEANLKRGDTVVLSILEHHSNVVPWLQLKEKLSISVVWIDCDDEGTLSLPDLKHALSSGSVKLVSVTGQSNVLGVRPPLKEIVSLSHGAGALVSIDAAQLVAHQEISVRDLDCDFLAFSGHKLYGPTGIGVLYGKRALLNSMPPFLGGGGMIAEVKRDRFLPADIPQKFEAGTPPIAEAVALDAAIKWLGRFPWSDIADHEAMLMRAAYETLGQVPEVRILGPRDPRSSHGCVSFVAESIHPHDLTDILGREGLCLRAGHHCTQPLHERFAVPASARLSVGIYTTEEEVRSVGPAVARALSILKK